MKRLFSYTWIDGDGNSHEGRVEAESEALAFKKLDEKGLVVVDVSSSSGALSGLIERFSKKRYKVSRRELIEFCIFMASLIDAGIPIVTAFDDFEKECSNSDFKEVVQTLHDETVNGTQLHVSMQQFPTVFNNEFTYLIGAAEKTGTLPSAFRELQRYMEWSERIDGDIKQATAYPKLVLTILIIFVVFLFSNIIPKIAAMLTGLGVPLPQITKVVLATSDFMVATWWIWIILFVVFPKILQITAKHIQKLALWLDSMKLELPVIGRLVSSIIQARFIYNFTVLHRAGISIVKNLELSEKFVGNLKYANAIDRIRREVTDGIRISDAMKQTGLFSGLVVRMVAAGERSGQLEQSLDKASTYYDQEIPRRVKKLLSFIEPALLLTLVAVVGVVALAVFLPMFSISGTAL